MRFAAIALKVLLFIVMAVIAFTYMEVDGKP
jgi:hypothetical protein